jgi:hypothetical protein
MRGARAAILRLLPALAPPGCIRTTGPVAGSMRVKVPLGTSLGPGDTVLFGERWL